MTKPRNHTRHGAAYRGRLMKGIESVNLWGKLMNLNWREVARDTRACAKALSKYVQWAYDNGIAFYIAKHGVLAMQIRFTHLFGNLRAAWETLKSRDLERPSRSRTPLAPIIRDALFATALLIAISETVPKEKYKWYWQI